MSGLRKAFQSNITKESDGIVIELPEAQNDDGTIPSFTIARMGNSNKAYSKALEAATRPYRRQVELGTMKNEVAEELLLKVFVDTVLKGWNHVQNDDGSEIAFSRDAAISLFSDPSMADLYSRLQTEAGLAANFRASRLEADAGN